MNHVGAPTPNFLSMNGQQSIPEAAYHDKAKGRYQTEDQMCDHGTTMHTNADVTSIIGADEMLGKNGSAAAGVDETTIVQDHDLQKLIG